MYSYILCWGRNACLIGTDLHRIAPSTILQTKSAPDFPALQTETQLQLYKNTLLLIIFAAGKRRYSCAIAASLSSRTQKSNQPANRRHKQSRELLHQILLYKTNLLIAPPATAIQNESANCSSSYLLSTNRMISETLQLLLAYKPQNATALAVLSSLKLLLQLCVQLYQNAAANTWNTNSLQQLTILKQRIAHTSLQPQQRLLVYKSNLQIATATACFLQTNPWISPAIALQIKSAPPTATQNVQLQLRLVYKTNPQIEQ